MMTDESIGSILRRDSPLTECLSFLPPFPICPRQSHMPPLPPISVSLTSSLQLGQYREGRPVPNTTAGLQT